MADRYYRRRLPRWRTDQATYFVTWRLTKSQPDLNPSERDLVTSSLRNFEGKRYLLTALVVTNDHIHVLLSMLKPYR